MIEAFDPKDPEEVDWINFDFRKRLARDKDTIATVNDVALAAGDAALLLDQFAESGGIVSARWRGGTRGTSYTITCSVTTAAGRTYNLSRTVWIEDQ